MKSSRIVLIIIFLKILSDINFSQTPYITPNFPIIADSLCLPAFSSIAPIISDLNKDGKNEIIVCASANCNPFHLWAIQYNAEPLEGFPVAIWNSPPLDIACGDVDSNGFLDIVIRKFDSISVYNNMGIIIPGFPVYVSPSNGSKKVTLYDLDNNGRLEIMTYGIGTVVVFNSDGTIRQGWPVNVIGTAMGSIAAADLDNDGFAEILFPSAVPGNPVTNSKLNILKQDGAPFPNWPQNYDSNYVSWFVGPTVKFNSNNKDSTTISITSQRDVGVAPYLNRITVYDIYGNTKRRFYDITYNDLQGVFPEDIITSSAGDEYCTGDQDPHVFLHSNDGALLPGWPQDGYGLPASSPLFGKVVLSEGLKIITNTNWANNLNGYIYGYNGDGSQLPWSPLRPLGVVMSIAFGDLDNDNNTELVAVTGQFNRTYIHCYTFPSVAFTRENFTWTMYGHDRYRTFQYGFIPPDEPIGVLPISNEIPGSYYLDQNYPNPFNPVTNIRFGITKKSMIKLAIYDILGRETSVLVDEELTPGQYNISWDASEFSSGIYFYRLTSGEFSETKKMTLIK